MTEVDRPPPGHSLRHSTENFSGSADPISGVRRAGSALLYGRRCRDGMTRHINTDPRAGRRHSLAWEHRQTAPGKLCGTETATGACFRDVAGAGGLYLEREEVLAVPGLWGRTDAGNSASGYVEYLVPE